jgi:hypothetical protein
MNCQTKLGGGHPVNLRRFFFTVTDCFFSSYLKGDVQIHRMSVLIGDHRGGDFLSTLSDEVLVHICGFCGAKALCRLAQTSRFFRDFVLANDIWKPLLFQRFGSLELDDEKPAILQFKRFDNVQRMFFRFEISWFSLFFSSFLFFQEAEDVFN